MISFLAPALLLGALAALVPLVLHLWGRRHARPTPFAAVDFLLRSNQQLARRLKLRRVALLLVRVGAVVAIPLVLARPYTEVTASRGAHLGSVGAVAVVLDDTLSTRALPTPGAAPRFEEQRRLAREAIASLPASAELALLRASEAGRPGARLSSDRAAALRALAAARPTAIGGSLDAAVQRAAGLLDGATAPPALERRILVVTDGAAHAFLGPPPRKVGDYPVAVVAPEDPPPRNHGIVDARVEPAPDVGGRGARIVAVLTSSGQPEPGLEVAVRVDGKLATRGAVDLPGAPAGSPPARVEKAFTLRFEPGVHEVLVEVAPDLLADDDRRAVRVEIRRDVRVLLVNGDPRSVRRDDELFYLETALRPGDDASSRIQVATIADPLEVPARLEGVDVVFLANPKTPPPAAVAALRAFVERGGGLFVSFGDNAEPAALGGALADLLPQEPSAVRVDDAHPERLGRIDRDHPLFQAVFDADAQGLRSALFRRYMLFAPTPDPKRRTLAALTSGAPLLLEREVGKGRVLAFASTVDRDWTDLPIRPGYLPLVQQAARQLARSPLEVPDPPVIVGRPREITLDDAAARARVEVTSPSGDRREVQRVGGKLPYDGVVEPGVYGVRVDGVARPDLGFVAALDPAESDLQPAPPAPAEATANAAAAAPRRRVDLWHLISAALLALLLGEALLVRRG